MMKYVGLIRGINVGGNRIVKMEALKTVVEEAGLRNPVSYIQSGNLIFESDLNEAEIEYLIASEIQKHFGFETEVMVISQINYENIVERIPVHWTNDADMKADVLFFKTCPDEIIKRTFSFNDQFEEYFWHDRALIYSILRKYQTKSTLLKLIKTTTYQALTIRNINTVRKLYQLLSETK